MKSAAVILNPIAGPARVRPGRDGVRRLLARHGCEAEVYETSGPLEATELAARAAGKHPIVVAAGGDGTVHEVAAGLVGTDAMMGLLPCGSGDDFAWGVGIRSARAGAEAIGAGRVRPIDVAWLDDRPFFNTAGFFLSGKVCARAVRLWRWLGPLRYVVGALTTIPFWKGQAAAWRLDGEDTPREGPWLLAEVSNGPRAGGGFRLAPDADPSDGLLDFCLVRQTGLLQVARIFPAAARGERFEHESVCRPVAAGGTLEIAEPTAAHLDGEAFVLSAGLHEFRLEPGKLRMLAPWKGNEE